MYRQLKFNIFNMRRIYFLFLALLSVISSANAQNTQRTAPQYRIVIKGGHVIDPKNNINEIFDIAIQDGKIARIAKKY